MVKSPARKEMDPRRTARTVALQSLFAADITGAGDRRARDGRTRETGPDYGWMDEEFDGSIMELAGRLHQGVREHWPGLDSLIGRYAPAWPVPQLPIVDRNILRIAIFELLHNPATPRKTAVDEAVEMAKTFGSDSSARFVNGVLGSIMADLESGEIPATAGNDGDRTHV